MNCEVSVSGLVDFVYVCLKAVLLLELIGCLSVVYHIIGYVWLHKYCYSLPIFFLLFWEFLILIVLGFGFAPNFVVVECVIFELSPAFPDFLGITVRENVVVHPLYLFGCS